MTSRRQGFTIIELLVAVMVSTILISVTVAVYSAFRKSMAADQSVAALSQNARVAIDRMSREIRQTPEIVTEMPLDEADTEIPQPGEIEFEDGHANDLTYKRYYLSGSYLKMDTVEYYLASNPSSRVQWDAVGNGGVVPLRRVISTQDVAESVQSVSVYGSKPLTLVLVTGDGSQEVSIRTKLYERNL